MPFAHRFVILVTFAATLVTFAVRFVTLLTLAVTFVTFALTFVTFASCDNLGKCLSYMEKCHIRHMSHMANLSHACFRTDRKPEIVNHIKTNNISYHQTFIFMGVFYFIG